MPRIGIVGISWRHRGQHDLAAFTIAREDRAAALPRLAREVGARELVYLATCNRVEIAFAADSRSRVNDFRRAIFSSLLGRTPASGEAEQTFRVWQDEGAVEHLFLVASGLDSARLGEGEVAVQVRDAYELAREVGIAGPALERPFREALRIARRIRPVAEARGGKVSMADIALDYVAERLRRTPGAVAVIGVSPITETCARTLADQGTPVVVVNRTLEHAQRLAAELGGEARALDDFRSAPNQVEALIVATASPNAVLNRADLERLSSRTRSGEPPLVIDLGVPPNVPPEDAAAADVPRMGMDQITNAAAQTREVLLAEFADARAVVDEALAEYRRETAERLIGPLIARLRRRYRDTAMEGVERLFAKHLTTLGETERDSVRRWAETLANRFAHVPSIGLRDLVCHLGPDGVEAFFRSTEPELAAELRAAIDGGGLPLSVFVEDEA